MSDKRTKNILLVGVGGQGTILASKLLTLGLMENGSAQMAGIFEKRWENRCQ